MHCAIYSIVQSWCASQYFLKLPAFVLIQKMPLSQLSSALHLNAGFSMLNRCVKSFTWNIYAFVSLPL